MLTTGKRRQLRESLSIYMYYLSMGILDCMVCPLPEIVDRTTMFKNIKIQLRKRTN